MFAALAWSTNYASIIQVEQSLHEGLLDQLAAEWTSSYMQRRMAARDPDLAAQARDLVFNRVNDVAGNLERISNVNYIPFTQAVKGVSWLYSTVSTVL